MGNRFDELDSMRGIAATSVMLSHLLGITPIFLVNLLANTPFHIFWAGYEAVILFFILSGFVLSLPYYNNKVPKYMDYIVRRICRIYIPYMASIVVALLFIILIPRINAPELTGWFRGVKPDITIKQLVNHVLFLGDFPSASYNFVIWSLVHEMRISLIFPILMYFIVKHDWKKMILIGMGISIFCLLTWYSGIKFLKYDIVKFDTSFLLTLHYTSFFMIGALLAKHRQFLQGYYMKITKGIKLSALIVAILAFTYSWWFFHNVYFLHFQFISDWIIAVGCCVFVIFSISSAKVRSFMLFKPINFIGKISYSLYLFHVIVELSLVNALYGKLPIGVIVVGSFVISFVVASVMYYAIEKPSIKLGKSLSNKESLAITDGANTQRTSRSLN